MNFLITNIYIEKEIIQVSNREINESSDVTVGFDAFGEKKGRKSESIFWQRIVQ